MEKTFHIRTMILILKMNRLLIPILTLLISSAAAQSELEVQNPPGQNWQIIHNEKSQVIFPKGIESQAQRVASILDYIEKEKKTGLGNKSLKVPVILHNHSMEPNGFVAYAPFRSEFFPLAIPDWNVTGSANWFDLLAIHEYRHVLQSSNADVGLTKLSRILTGRLGWSTTMQLTMPNWFMEGDAVLSETLFTESGRGRMPSFSVEQRAAFHAGKEFSYMKARHGSFKTLIPSHYPFGYLMSLYVRKHYGEQSWLRIIHQANWFKSVIYPFSGAVKDVTAKRPTKIYRAAYSEFRNHTNNLLKNKSFTKTEGISTPQKTVTYYTYNYPLEDGNFLVRKSSYKETAAIYLIDSIGKEKKLVDIGHSDNPFLSFGNQAVIWVENKPHPYYGNVDFQRIALYDWKTDRKRYLLEGKKTYFAAISPDDKKIAAIEFDSTMNFILNEYTSEGKFIKNHRIPDNIELAYPIYDQQNPDILFYTLKKDGRQFWAKHLLKTNEIQLLSEGYAYAMVEPSQNEEMLFFRAGFNGIDNIYSIPKNGSKVIQQITQTEVGAGYPAVQNNELTFASYHIKGTSLVKSNIQSKPVVIFSPTENPVFYAVNDLQEKDNILEHLPENQQSVKKYHNWFQGWRLHSWGMIPSLTSANNESRTPALSEATFFVMMDDILSHNAINAEYTHYFNEGESAWKIDWSMAPSFPVFKLGYEFRDRNTYLPGGTLAGRYNEQELRAGIRIPLETYKHNYRFITRLDANVKGIKPFNTHENGTIDNSLFGLYHASGLFGITRRQAYQNLQPKFGFTVLADYAQSFTTGIAGKQTYSGVIYLPGIGKNHGINVQISHQYENLSNTYQFPDNFASGRGYYIGGLQQSTWLGINYRLPLIYPDLGIPGLTYIRRIRANGFFDMARIANATRSTVVRSVGIELMADQTSLNFLFIPVGIRIGYRLPNPNLNFESPLFINLLLGN
jgi:hypothetical protein